MAIQLPVIAKEPVRKESPGQHGETIPKANFDVCLVRIGGNNKTSDNVTDTTRGCSGGCYGCYAARSMGVFQGRRRFDQPETQIVVGEIVQHDLLEMVRKEPYLDWVRNGVMGDPSLDWDSAVELSEYAGRVGIRTVIISKFWTLPTDEHLKRLALSGAILHFSLIPGYEWAPDLVVGRRTDGNRVRDICSALVAYDKMTRPKGMKEADSVYMRICSAEFDRDHPIGGLLAHTQDFFANFAKKQGFRILETPWKFEGKSDPRWEFLDHEKMDRAKSYTLGEGRGRKKTAGPILSPEGFDKYKEWKPFVIACDTTCDVCPNQCGTVDHEKGADVRIMIQNGEKISIKN